MGRETVQEAGRLYFLGHNRQWVCNKILQPQNSKRGNKSEKSKQRYVWFWYRSAKSNVVQHFLVCAGGKLSSITVNKTGNGIGKTHTKERE